MKESDLYEPTREFLHSKFLKNFGNCYLEITASGHFEETLQKAVEEDIILAVLKRGYSPDLVGFIEDKRGIKDFITVEIKLGKISLKDIGQAKIYGDLFRARYALLITPQPIPEIIRRLHRKVFILNRVTQGYIHIGQLKFGQPATISGPVLPVEVIKEDWFPESPSQITVRAVPTVRPPTKRPPALPHAFYGTVLINGSPAPIGSKVEARGEGVRIGIQGNPIETEEVGKYGSADPLGAKLVVQGDIAEGTRLTFYVNGVRAKCREPSTETWLDSYQWHSGEVTKFDLKRCK